MMQNMYTAMGISPEVYEYGEQTLVSLKDRFDEIDKTAEYNQLKVLKAMQDCRVSEACLLGTTGYGYNDIGRDTLEAVYASLFHTEAAPHSLLRSSTAARLMLPSAFSVHPSGYGFPFSILISFVSFTFLFPPSDLFSILFQYSTNNSCMPPQVTV